MRKTHTLTTKLLLMGLGFLLVAITSIGLTLWITWKLEGSAAAVNEAGRLRMHTLRLALALPNEPLPELQQRVNQFNASLDLLQTGDPGRPLYVPWRQKSRARFADIRATWAALHHQWLGPSPPSAPAVLLQADAFVARMDNFVDAIEIEIVRWTAVLHLFQLFLVAVAIAAAVAFMASAIGWCSVLWRCYSRR